MPEKRYTAETLNSELIRGEPPLYSLSVTSGSEAPPDLCSRASFAPLKD